MGLEISIEYEAPVQELIQRYKSFSFLKNAEVQEDSAISWYRGDDISFDVQAIFIGKTGYGKSSTLNEIVGNKVFETNDIASCTKKLHSAEYKIHSEKPYYFSLCDLPGIGESEEADEKYSAWYKSTLKKSACVVYLLRADQRDYALDEKVFKSLFKSENEKEKVVIGLNYADKVEPINRKTPFVPTQAQLDNLRVKEDFIGDLFGISTERIISYSASENYNLMDLIQQISKVVKRSTLG